MNIPSNLVKILEILTFFIVWELIGRLRIVADGALPSVSEILIKFWEDRNDYPEHIFATIEGAGYGFLIGNLVAILAGTIFALFPWANKIFRGFNIVIFALPPIVLAPILSLTLTGIAPRIVMAALGCYFITMTATYIGLTRSESTTINLIKSYGGGKFKHFFYVSWFRALPVILGGIAVTAPNAVLGSILAEFGGGSRWGLGVYLIGSLGRGEPARLWGIGILATLISGVGYLFFSLLGKKYSSASKSIDIGNSLPNEKIASSESYSVKILIVLISFTLPFLTWYFFILLLKVPPMIGKNPFDVFYYVFLSPNHLFTQSKLILALSETLPITFVGMLVGLGTAFVLGVGSRYFPRIVNIAMPLALITQTMPLVALTPLLVLILGRDYSVILWITTSVTFFPAFIIIVQGINLIPKLALEVVKVYGVSKLKELAIVIIPSTLPFLFTAVKLTAPRALLGVMIAEWLATGTGLGNLMNQSRGYLDFSMIWTVAAVSVALSVLFYQLTIFLERKLLQSYNFHSYN